MDKYDAAQVILRFIFDNENTDTTKILAHVQREHEPQADLDWIGDTVLWLRNTGYVDGTFTFGPDALHLKPTEKGSGSILSGKTIKELLGLAHSQPEPSVSNTLSIGNNYGNASQGDYNHLSQTSIDPAALDGLLEVMRSHGDDLTAAELERLERSGDKPGFWEKLGERFSGKAVDAAAGRTVDYAADALPWLVMLFGGALGIPVG